VIPVESPTERNDVGVLTVITTGRSSGERPRKGKDEERSISWR
jgi:hypothetical protein